MKKKAVLKKLYTLDVLINQTEPDIMPDSHLFSAHTIENQTNMMMIEEGRCSTRDIKDIMQKSNVMWTMRNKIKNGEWETLEPLYELEMELRDLCQNGNKIQAIKRYRSYMDRNYNIDITLKIAKYTIDALSEQKPVDLMTGVKVD
jgi:ribosomal protein L7/L12